MLKKKSMAAWIDARMRHRLSHAQVQMARELGMNPNKLGKLDNHNQEPWKMPLGRYIEHLYFKRVGKERPDTVLSIEQNGRQAEEKKSKKREERMRCRQNEAIEEPESRKPDFSPFYGER